MDSAGTGREDCLAIAEWEHMSGFPTGDCEEGRGSLLLLGDSRSSAPW